MSTQITIASKLPYKVFTALLTQSDGDNPIVVSGDGGQIVLGVTYYINTNSGQDLIIYGAPNNNVGTYFIANQTTYLPYSDTLGLTANTGAPVVTVLENTIGNIWFAGFSANFSVYSDNLFSQSFLNSFGFYDNETDEAGLLVANLNNMASNVIAYQLFALNGTITNINNLPFEIRVYN